MKTLRLGFDLDGVFVNFQQAFTELFVTLTGRDLFPPRPFDAPCWDYPQHFGYTDAESDQVWAHIKASDTFWQQLPQYAHASSAMYLIYALSHQRHEVYFVTSREGVRVKAQTERWLSNRLIGYVPTVLLSDGAGHKAEIAAALRLDGFIDDKYENVVAVRHALPHGLVYLFNQPWNDAYADPFRTSDVGEYIDAVLRHGR